MLYSVMLFYVMLCYITLHYIMLFYNTFLVESVFKHVGELAKSDC